MGICYAKNCEKEIPRERLMCLAHWKLVSPETQREVWAAFRRQDNRAMVASWQKARAEVEVRLESSRKV